MIAMMTKKDGNRNTIEFAEIVDFFYKSWTWGFKHLGWLIKRDKSRLYY